MERRSYTPLTQEQRDARAQAAEAKLTAALEKLTGEESFKHYLDMQARFHHYSPSNVLMILSQRPDATLVAGVRKWNDLGRFVHKGEKGIDIWAPVFPKKEDRPNPEVEGDPVGFIPVKVFAYEQTHGKPLPAPPRVPELKGEEGGMVYAPMVLGALDKDFLVFEEDDLDTAGSLMGFYGPDDKVIVIGRSHKGVPRSQLQRAKTLAHEFAHGLNHHGSKEDRTTEPERETVAEGSAYVALSHFGVDTSERSFPYIANFAKDTKVLKRVLSTIQRTARTIIDSTEQHCCEERPVEVVADTQRVRPDVAHQPQTRSMVSRRPSNFSLYYGFAGGDGRPVITPYAPRPAR